MSGGVSTIPGCGPDPINEFQAIGIASTANTVGVLRDDHIAGTTVAPVREIQCCGFTATAIVKAN